MKNRQAFTLIELLVVIAIIAILAAILFPVFAQAKAAAKGTQELSGIKQISTATAIYLNDFDDNYPWALDNLWQHTWATDVEPYTKSLPLFLSPFDNLKALPAGDSWAGNVTDYSANAMITNWDNANGPTNFAHLRGLFCANAQPTGADWIDLSSQNATAVTQPGNTIEFAPKYQSQVIAAGAGFGNTTAFCGASFMSFYSDTGVAADGGGGSWDWCSDMEMPNGGIQNPGTSFPFTRTGAVGMGRANVANFAFSDTHAKSMTPAATNPDGDNRPADNMWDALR